MTGTDFATVVRRARERREPLRATGITAFRLLNEAGDGLPGVTCDWLGGFGLVQVTGRVPRDALFPVLQKEGRVRGIYEKREPSGAQHVAGEKAPREIEVFVDGVRYGIRLAEGDKAGLYLDQRENRLAFLARLRGASVLNLFCFTGAWGLAAAARGRAGETTNVDLSRKALDRARENFRRNGIDPASHRFVVADALDYLGLAGKKGLRFGAVVLDPPSFARGRHGEGGFAWRKDWPGLLRGALAVLSPGGILAATTHTRGLIRKGFPGFLARIAEEEGRTLEVLAVRGLPSDFPPPPGERADDRLVFCLGRA